MEMLYAAGIGVLAIVGYWYVRKVQKHGSKDSTSRITQEIAAYTPIEEAEIAGLTELERLTAQLKGISVRLNQYALYQADAAGLWGIAQESSRPLLVLVMGEFKTGKSTFINTILAEDVLTADAAPATAVTSLLRYGTEKKVLLHYEDGHEASYPFAKLAEITAEGDDSKRELRESLAYVEIFLPNTMLQQINLIDTPGLNVHRESHIKNTEGFKDKADVVLWVFNAARSATRTEIQEIKALGERLKPFAVVNRIDNIDEEEESVADVLSGVEKRLSGSVQAVFGVSAKLAREAVKAGDAALLQQCGWTGFMSKLESHFLGCAGALKLTAISDKAQEFTSRFAGRIRELERAAEDNEKKFASREEGMENIRNELRFFWKLKEKSLESLSRIESSNQFFMEKLKPAREQVELIDDASFYKKGMDMLLNCIVPVLPVADAFEEFSKERDGFQEAAAIARDILMLNDDIDVEVLQFETWLQGMQELDERQVKLEAKKSRMESLETEYRHSGMFGGEPVFDFSGKRERFNRSVQAYNDYLKDFRAIVYTHWAKYVDICADANAKNKDVKKVVERMKAFLEKMDRQYREEMQRFEQDFDRARQEHVQLCDDIRAGQCLLAALEAVVAEGSAEEAVG